MKNSLSKIFTSIKNGQLVKHLFIYEKTKKNCEIFLKILWKEGFILGYSLQKNNNLIKIFLKYNKNKPTINNIKFLTRPGRKIYLTTKQIWKIETTENLIIFSTNKGFKTLDECKKFNLGGEPFIIVN
jgi:small subunit ribosomal protein S8